MATSRNVMMAPLLMILAGMQVCNAERDALPEFVDASKIISAMQGVAQAINCYGDSMQGHSFMMKDQISKQNENIGVLQKEVVDLRSVVERLAELQAKNEENKQKALDVERKFKESLVKIGELEEKAKELNKTAEDANKKLNESLVKIGELEEKVKLLNKTVVEMEPDKRCPLKNEHEIRKAVQEYNRSKDWEPLRKSLGDSIDHGSLAYGQWQDIEDSSYPLYYVGYRGHKDLAEVLVYCGGGVNMSNSNGYTLLHATAFGNQPELAKFLLDNGADTEARTIYSGTPLICAAAYGYLEIVKLLVQAGADTAARDKFGKTALDTAIRDGRENVVQYLSQFPH